MWFSAVKGILSQIVPMRTRSRSHFSWPFFIRFSFARAWANLKATPTPARFFNGPSLKSFRFGLMTARASGRVSPTSWWSVMIVSIFSSFSSFTISWLREPQSTVITRLAPNFSAALMSFGLIP